MKIEFTTNEVKEILASYKSSDWYFCTDTEKAIVKKLYEALGLEPNYDRKGEVAYSFFNDN